MIISIPSKSKDTSITIHPLPIIYSDPTLISISTRHIEKIVRIVDFQKVLREFHIQPIKTKGDNFYYSYDNLSDWRDVIDRCEFVFPQLVIKNHYISLSGEDFKILEPDYVEEPYCVWQHNINMPSDDSLWFSLSYRAGKYNLQNLGKNDIEIKDKDLDIALSSLKDKIYENYGNDFNTSIFIRKI